MEQRRRPSGEKINYRVSARSGHIYSPHISEKTKNQIPYSVSQIHIIPTKNNKTYSKKSTRSAKVNYIDDYRNKSKVKEKRSFLKKITLNKGSFKNFKSFIVVGLLVTFSFVAVYQNTQVQSWGLKVSDANAKLTELKNQNEALKQEKAALTNLDRIERIAKNDLKMVAPTSTILFESKRFQKEKTN